MHVVREMKYFELIIIMYPYMIKYLVIYLISCLIFDNWIYLNKMFYLGIYMIL